jgi:hypothetical protein
MRFLILLLLTISFSSFSQEKTFKFETVDMRTPNGWNVKNISGEVIFYEDDESHTISIVTENRNYKMYVKSKQLFIREYNYLYTLIDDDGDESRIRIVMENKCDDYVEFYFYSDRPGEKYFRLCLKRCDKKILKNT